MSITYAVRSAFPASDWTAIGYTFRGASGGIGAQHGEAGALRILHDAGESVVGAGEPTATVHTTR